MGAPERPLTDPGNRFTGPAETDLTTGRVKLTAPGTGTVHEFAVLTIRQGNTTLTLMLSKDELGGWIGTLQDTHGNMTGLTLGGPTMPFPPNGHPRGRG